MADTASTTSTKRRNKFVEQCHMTTVALKMRDHIQEKGLTKETLESARSFIRDDPMLKKMGYCGKSSSEINDINPFFKYLDLQLVAEEIGRGESVNGKRGSRIYEYNLITISMKDNIESWLAGNPVKPVSKLPKPEKEASPVKEKSQRNKANLKSKKHAVVNDSTIAQIRANMPNTD